MTVRLVAAKCPNCHADLQIPDHLDKAHCVYCGSTIIIDKSSDSSIQMNNLIILAKRESESEDWDKSIEYCDKALQLNPNNPIILKISEKALFEKGRALVNQAIKLGQQAQSIPTTNVGVLDVLVSDPITLQLKSAGKKQDEINMTNYAS